MSLLVIGNRLAECRETLQQGDPRSALVSLKEAMASLLENAPFAWTGAKQGTRAQVGDFLKRKAFAAGGMVGAGGKARQMAKDAFNQGQAALSSSDQVHKDVDKFTKKGETNRAVDAHNFAVKKHAAAMQSFKRVMDQANKEGDRETADWAAKAGAIHTNARTQHMKLGSSLRQWATGGSAPAAQHAPAGSPPAPGQHAPAAPAPAPNQTAPGRPMAQTPRMGAAPGAGTVGMPGKPGMGPMVRAGYHQFNQQAARRQPVSPVAPTGMSAPPAGAAAAPAPAASPAAKRIRKKKAVGAP